MSVDGVLIDTVRAKRIVESLLRFSRRPREEEKGPVPLRPIRPVARWQLMIALTLSVPCADWFTPCDQAVTVRVQTADGKNLSPQQISAEVLAKMKKMPSEYFRSNLYATFWFEKGRGHLQHLIDVALKDGDRCDVAGSRPVAVIVAPPLRPAPPRGGRAGRPRQREVPVRGRLGARPRGPRPR